MTSWKEFSEAEPDLAERAKAIFDRHIHKTMATLRKDGSPRISGMELDFNDGEVQFGMMPGSLKAQDLQRDPRLAVHSASEGYDKDDPSSWPPDAKLAGRAVEVPADGHHQFKVDITEVVVTGIGDPPDHLLVEMWTAAGGRKQVKRK